MTEHLYQQLERELKLAIESGRFPPGDRLPSIRQLCAERSLSKATVLRAYERLEARGLIEARPKAGYFVRVRLLPRRQPDASNPDSTPAPVNVSEVMRDIMTQSAAFDILPGTREQPDTPPGIVELNRSVARALRHQRGLQHQYYDEPAGCAALREQLGRRYQRLGCALSPDQLTVTAGCQQALFLALMSCCRPGDVVAVESPGFYGVLQLLEALGLQALEIPTTPATGLDLAVLERALQRWPVKACVITPAFATPTGATMPPASRRRLLKLAGDHDLVIIEDDIYGDLGFDTRPSPLKALDTRERVILCGSLSKSLSRDLRLGWVAAGPRQAEINRLKLVTTLAGSRFVQQGLADYLAEGAYERHLRRQRALLRQQRDELLALLERDWPQPVRCTVPEGGLTLWVELAPHIDTLRQYPIARQAGIIITPGALFTSQARYRNCLRLSFAHPWQTERRRALQQLGQLLARA